jgi:hypothetical protein
LLRRTASAKVISCASGIFLPEGFLFFVTYKFFHATAIPEASIEALKAQVAALQGTTSIFPVNLLLCVSSVFVFSLTSSFSAFS